ncbi:MAG: efflux RND transporter periplasmic adaptor subunit [Myxococcales bacterium]|nr:efflux RND transporter periplasmic adaptor subunit [Myxococcales bacterium]
MTTASNVSALAGAPGAAPGSSTTDAELLAEITKKRTPWGWILLALLVVGGGALVFWRVKGAKPAQIRYVTTRVTSGEVVESIEATGTVQPLLQVQVGAQVSGRVLRVHTDFNQTVTEGQLLAELDPDPFMTRVNEARAAEASARASLARARADLVIKERDLARARDLRARGLNAQAELDAALGARDLSRAAINVSQAELARTQATLASARNQLAQSKIFAPMAGLVISRQIDPGQTVAASLQAPTLFIIAQDLTRMRVMADVDEADIGRMREGMAVEARVDAFQGDRFRGTVTQLRYGATTTAGVVTYPAVIEVPNPELKLRPGMTATVTVTTARLENVLRVPNAALRYRPSNSDGASTGGGRRRGDRDAGAGNGAAGNGGNDSESPATRGAGPRGGRVFVLREGRPVPVRVRIVATDGSNTAVESPELHDGSEVVTDEVDDGASRGGAASSGAPAGGSSGSSRGGSRGPRMF